MAAFDEHIVFQVLQHADPDTFRNALLAGGKSFFDTAKHMEMIYTVDYTRCSYYDTTFRVEDRAALPHLLSAFKVDMIFDSLNDYEFIRTFQEIVGPLEPGEAPCAVPFVYAVHVSHVPKTYADACKGVFHVAILTNCLDDFLQGITSLAESPELSTTVRLGASVRLCLPLEVYKPLKESKAILKNVKIQEDLTVPIWFSYAQKIMDKTAGKLIEICGFCSVPLTALLNHFCPHLDTLED